MPFTEAPLKPRKDQCHQVFLELLAAADHSRKKVEHRGARKKSPSRGFLPVLSLQMLTYLSTVLPGEGEILQGQLFQHMAMARKVTETLNQSLAHMG